MDANALTACINRASHFLETHGPPWTQAMARFITARGSRDDVITALSKYQNDDGGWWGIGTLKAPISTISNTINGLHWLAILNAHTDPLLDNTTAFLQRTQHPGGFWDEPEEILQHAPKMWMAPGKPANQVWYTAALCRYLLEHGRSDAVNFNAALSYLYQAWNGERFPQFEHTHWMALYLFTKLPQQSDLTHQIVKKSLIILNDFAHLTNVNHGELGEVAYAALLAGAPAQDLLQKLIQRLSNEQDETGYWGNTQSDAEDRVTNTMKVLGFWYRYQQVLNGQTKPDET